MVTYYCMYTDRYCPPPKVNFHNIKIIVMNNTNIIEGIVMYSRWIKSEILLDSLYIFESKRANKDRQYIYCVKASCYRSGYPDSGFLS